jgi:hypothetical protein
MLVNQRQLGLVKQDTVPVLDSLRYLTGGTLGRRG